MSKSFDAMQIVGYADRLSVRPGDTIAFKVSAYIGGKFSADLVRVVSGDKTPGGAGFEEHPVAAEFAGEYPCIRQSVNIGSFGLVEISRDLKIEEQILDAGFTLQALAYPTTPQSGRQGIAGVLSTGSLSSGVSIGIEDGNLALFYANRAGELEVIRSDKRLVERCWQQIGVAYDPKNRSVSFHHWEVGPPSFDPPIHTPSHSVHLEDGLQLCNTHQFHIAGFASASEADAAAQSGACNHYNGKLERIRWTAAPLSEVEIKALSAAVSPPVEQKALLGFWDFSIGIGTDCITDLGPLGLDGRLVNLPSRATSGFNWDGAECNWRHAPHFYGAIHFHDDDLYDCAWDTTFSFRVPDAQASGIYAARLRVDQHEYRVPFFVRPGRNARRADIAFVASTATYMAYANNMHTAELIYAATNDANFLDEVYCTLKAHPEFGRSTYDTHSDGSGVRYASRLRPQVDVQPGLTKMWTLNADTLVTAWLERSGYTFDILTDEDLHRDGSESLDGYRLVITGSHPEYMSLRMREAFDGHLSRGGRLMYLGGNGFYMRVAFSDVYNAAIEMRRVSQPLAGLWDEVPSDSYFSFTGEQAGLWRNLHPNPYSSVGVGFENLTITTELNFTPTPEASSSRASFIFAGVEGTIRNDFGAIYGPLGADEFDRCDKMRGSPRHALVVAIGLPDAAANAFGEHFQADMTFFETPSGGAVFSTSSISWGLGLNQNHRDNGVSKVMKNVVDRFVSEIPFALPDAEG